MYTYQEFLTKLFIAFASLFILSCKGFIPAIPFIFEQPVYTVLSDLEKINKILPPHLEKYSLLIYKACEKYKVDFYLVLSIMQIESNFNTIARSNKNAMGLMQLKSIHGKNITNIEYNIITGIRFLSWLQSKSGNDFDLLLASYNFGRKNALNRTWPIETQQYIFKVKCTLNIFSNL